jgi:hypothetical protein
VIGCQTYTKVTYFPETIFGFKYICSSQVRLMKYPLYPTDAFTDRDFGGVPPSSTQQQHIAAKGVLYLLYVVARLYDQGV